MPSIVDAFIVELGLDPSKFKQGEKEQAAPKAVGASGALPEVPKDKAQLVKGQVYNTARGPALWDGQQFVKQ